MKFVLLRRDDATGQWDHIGAVDVEGPEEDEWVQDDALAAAVEAVAAQGGVFVPVPMHHWRLFEAEAKVTVRPVQRVVGTATPPADIDLSDPDTEVEIVGRMESMDGMLRPARPGR